MGRPKPWIEVGGVPLLRRVVDAARALDDVRVVVVGASDRPLPPLPEDVDVVSDPPERAGAGPLAAVVTGLERLDALRIASAYVGTGDAIGLGAAHVGFMLERLEHSGAVAVIPVEHDETGEVVHALSGAVRVADGIAVGLRALASGERSVRAWLAALGAVAIPVNELPDPGALRPCNTPADVIEFGGDR
jgi:molybdopterin-guanine dinucleotide biosynthesis protein A